MTALAWTLAVVFFALWLIEHVGGADARARLRAQRDHFADLHARAEWDRIVADSLRLAERDNVIPMRREGGR